MHRPRKSVMGPCFWELPFDESQSHEKGRIAVDGVGGDHGSQTLHGVWAFERTPRSVQAAQRRQTHFPRLSLFCI